MFLFLDLGSGARVKILVGIAHHGSKNRPFLLRMLAEFEAMPYHVDVVILAEEEKDLGEGVQVRVGAPTDDPWSLPFAHRSLFAEHRDNYDLFIYSEDDTLITRAHIDTFLDLSDRLPHDQLPGFMRYERYPDGTRSYCTMHSFYRWDPTSIFRHDGLTFARFTNDHAACYLLTREQLASAIDSGGFLIPPHKGRYDMLVSAATDPYTRCGFMKVICIERIEDMLVHHLPNVYLGKLGVDEKVFQAQLSAISAIADGTLSTDQYLIPEVNLPTSLWSKHVFLDDADLASLVGSPGHLVSLGVGDGRIEASLQRVGWQVTAVPIDNVLAAAARARGVTTTSPVSLQTSTDLKPASVDVVLALDTLGYLPDPISELRAAREILKPGGRLFATVPDHRRYRLRDRLRQAGRVDLPRDHHHDGVHFTDKATLRRWLQDAGFHIEDLQHRRATRSRPVGRGDLRSRVLGNSWLARARPRP